jgi:hypothetical protein
MFLKCLCAIKQLLKQFELFFFGHGFSLAKRGEAPPAESKKESRDFITIPPAALHLERGWPVRTGIVNSLALRLRRDCMSGQGNSH